MTYNGGLVGSLNTPDTSTASGVWSVTDHALYTKAEAWPQPLQPDPYFSRVQLLVQNGVATNLGSGGTLDSGTATWGSTDYVLEGSDASVKIGDGNKYFFAPHQSAYNDLSQGWCLESWMYMTSPGSSNYIMSKWSSPWQWTVQTANSGNPLTFTFRNTSSQDNGDSISGIALNQWFHFAFVLDPSPYNWRIYINGVQQSSGSFNGTPNTSSTTRIGFGYKEDSSGVWNGTGWLDRTRITMKNRYTTNFVPPNKSLPVL